jgi:hypothetical protein
MKKLLILMLVLCLATVANAYTLISVDGVVDPEESTVTLYPSETAHIDIHSDVTLMGYLFVEGDGDLDSSTANYFWEQSSVADMNESSVPPEEDLRALLYNYFGYQAVGNIVEFQVVDSSEPFTDPDGLVIDCMTFHCTGPEEAVIYLIDAEGTLLDTQVIHQPEPMTIALLGLGGLFLRRRK